jgi:hypothetical protein
MRTDDPMQEGRPDRAKRSLVSRIVWVTSILAILAGLLFVGLIVAIGLLQGDPGGQYLQIENRTDQTVKIFKVFEASGEERTLYATIPPRSSFPTGDDCGSAEMIATTSAGTEIARRGPFEECHLERWVIREVPGT